MNDILFGNNNGAIIRKITWRTIKTNKTRNFFVIVAIMLTTVLLAVAFSIGISMLKSMEMQKIRMSGSVADAYIINPNDEQIETLRKQNYIDKVGIGIAVGRVSDKQEVGNIDLMLVYIDGVQWEEINAPAFSDITGVYPSAENEIMLSRWTLGHMGIDTPKIGMSVSFTYDALNGSDVSYDGVFTLTGYFTNYYYANSGGNDYALVSKALSDKYGCSAQSQGTANIVFKNHNSTYLAQLSEDITLNADQEVIGYDTKISGGSYVSTFVILLFLAMLFMAGGYLLIYNTMLISLSRDIRNYAQLKTIGMTPRQIRQVVLYTVVFFCCIGIPFGLIIAEMISSLIVPGVISANGIFTGSVLSHSPLIYIEASLFALATALIAAFTPARKASSISPVEGSRYTESIARAVPVKLARRFSKPVSMALRNLFRGGKRCVIVMVSMTLSIVILIVTETVASSIDVEKYAAYFLDCDIRLENTATLHKIGVDIFSGDLLSAVETLPHLQSRQIITLAYCSAAYDGIPFEDDRLIGVYGIDEEAILALNEKLGINIDVDGFARGEFAIMGASDTDRWRDVQRVSGEFITGVSKIGMAFELPLRAVVPNGSVIGTEAEIMIFISNSYLSSIADELQILRIDLNFEDSCDAEAYHMLRELTKADNNISLLSRYEARQSIGEIITMLSVLGGSISTVFGIIGVLNFINVMVVGVLSRKRELAILECVGMERGQTRKMLLSEGAWYGAISLLFGNIFGAAIVAILFAGLFSTVPYMAVHFPIMLFALFYGLVLFVCVVAPIVMYNSVSKSTLSERLRQIE